MWQRLRQFFPRMHRSTRAHPSASAGWVEETFVFEKPQAKQITTVESGVFLGTYFSSRKYHFLLILIVATLLAFFSRMFYIQIIQGGSYMALATGNSQRIVPIPAERGIIYDRYGIDLTKNIPKFSLALVPQDLPKTQARREAVIERLSELTTRPVADIRSIIEEYGDYSFESIIIAENIDYETALSIQIAAADLPGITIQRGSKRLYVAAMTDQATSTSPQALAHVLGYEGKLTRSELDALYTQGYLPSDSLGKTGIEKSYETILRGTYGKKRIEVNALGREQHVLAEVAPVPGQHLILSIDKKIQDKLEELLLQTMKQYNKQRASAIATDPRTGEILALISLPAYDNNHFSGGISQTQYSLYTEDSNQPLFNRAVSGKYPSGSTIKPALAAAGLTEGVITPKTTFLSTGGLSVGPWFFPDWQAGGHGATDVKKSLANSVNTFYYYLGGGYNNFTGLGIERIGRYLSLFGFGATLGIDLPGEAAGFIPSPEWKEKTKGERWYIGDTYNVSIGQGDLLVSPLQIAFMTAAIANNGTLYEPHLVRAMVNPVTGRSRTTSPKIIRSQIVPNEHLAIVQQGMRDCVTGGSCRRLNSIPLTIAGKTGTAQWNANKPNHAWFTSFAPVEQPEITITILIEEGEEGSRTAVPVADGFYRWWANYRQERGGEKPVPVLPGIKSQPS